MDRIVLPGAGFEISRLSFGTAHLHHILSSRRRQALLATAAEHGFTHFDSAPYYGFGLAEQELGVFLQSKRGAVSIASKIGMYPPGAAYQTAVTIWARKGLGKVVPRLSRPVIDWSIASAARSLELSLRRLRTEWIDILLLHEPDPALVNSDEFLSWLLEEKRKGKIRAWGLAGVSSRMGSWLSTDHPLGMVLQVRDSLANKEADDVLRNGRDLQITYGYLSSSANLAEPRLVEDVLLQALCRNSTGSVLVSTRRLEHVAGLAAAGNGRCP